MGITADQIVLRASRVMADVPEGGGGPSNVAIESGQSNNIFPDVTEADRAGGNLSMRQLHLAVTSPNTDVAMGCNVIVSERADDPNVATVLMETAGDFATRAQDLARMEAGFIASGMYPGTLYGNHPKGLSVLMIYQRLETELPADGSTLALMAREGHSNEVVQYVRVQTIASNVVMTFTDERGDYQYRVLTLRLAQKLQADFEGFDAERHTIDERRIRQRTRIRRTVWGGAANYYGIKKLTQDAKLGDTLIHCDGIHERVVPSGEVETILPYTAPLGVRDVAVAGGAPVVYTTALPWSPERRLQLPGGCLPGSLEVVAGSVRITDRAGALRTAAGQVGSVDYANGLLTLAQGEVSGVKTVTYRPASVAPRLPQTTEIRVTEQARSTSYVAILVPLPAPGSVSLAYAAQGNWYVLTDDGGGQLTSGDPAHGVGTIDYATGALAVTLGALPDVNSSIVIGWGVPTQETVHPQAALQASQSVALTTPEGEAVQPGTVSLAWSHGEHSYTASADAAGRVTGDATGVFSRTGSRLEFAPAVLPPPGTQVTASYKTGAKTEDSFEHPARGGDGKLTITASLQTIEPGSLEIEWNTLTDLSVLGTYSKQQIDEMGIGVMVDPIHVARDDGAGKLMLGSAVIGTVDYGTGVVKFRPDVDIAIPRPSYSATVISGTGTGNDDERYRLSYRGMEYVSAPTTYPNDTSGWVKARYNSAAAMNNQTQVFDFAPALRLVPGLSAQVVPGSVLLRASSGALWGDSGTGLLREPVEGGWATRGAINYLTGEVQLSAWPDGLDGAVQRLGCVTTVGEMIASEYVFRTPQAPLRPGSLSVQFARHGGGVQTVTANAHGEIAAPGVAGSVDVQAGVVRLHFGQMVTAVGNESEPWYQASKVQSNGQIWRPEPVAASTVRFTAVAYQYVPVDPAIVGVDPVRLPSDGRVPIFQPGGYVVVHKRGALPAQTVTNGQTVDLGVTRLSRVEMTGANGRAITTGWSRDLDAGTVQVVDASGWAQPVTVGWTVEHMAVVREVDIRGRLLLNRPLPHTFPAEVSSVSSALMLGNRFARVSAVFDQLNWDGVTWADNLTGPPAVATYSRDVPVEVDNRGAITERWIVRLTSATHFQVIGEHVGVVATGSIHEDCAPINPITQTPYFTLRALGWGTGWIAGNVLRINTVGASCGFCVIRAVQPGEYSSAQHQFALLARVDVDRP